MSGMRRRPKFRGSLIEIKEAATGRRIPARILSGSKQDLRSLRGKWLFEWVSQSRKSEIFKLIAGEDPESILGLLAIARKPGFVEVSLLENSPPNVGRGKVFKYIAANLLAFAARLSFELDNDGVLMLTSKTALIDHYEKTYGFCVYQGRQKMILDTKASIQLVRSLSGEK